MGTSTSSWGDFFEPGLLFIENRGSCAAPNLRGEPAPFPLDDPVRTSGYNAPAFGDVDGDGDLDLLIGVLGGAFNPNTSTVENLIYLPQGMTRENSGSRPGPSSRRSMRGARASPSSSTWTATATWIS